MAKVYNILFIHDILYFDLLDRTNINYYEKYINTKRIWMV